MVASKSPVNKRVVVTGTGAVCGLGCGVSVIWDRLVTGESAIIKLDSEVFHDLDTQIAAPVRNSADDAFGFDIDALLSTKDQKRTDRFIHLALEAAQQAVTEANWTPVDKRQKERTATIVGSSLGGFLAATHATRKYDNQGAGRMSPHTVPSMLTNLAAGHISIKYDFRGPLGAPANACAASAQAIGDGMRLIKAGDVDVAICGGTEACIDPIILASFVSAKAVSVKYNANPAAASRPFDVDRDGFVLGEGAAILVLEELEHALARGVTPLAELVGYGTTSDAFHVTCCHEDGDALQRSMLAAMDMARLDSQSIDYINAHGTSTPLGDKAEIIAIKTVFGINNNLCISSTKSSTGHLLGAAAALEAVFSVQALKCQFVPPTLNLAKTDKSAEGLNIVGNIGEARNLDHVISNSAGFGGVNASLIFKRWI